MSDIKKAKVHPELGQAFATFANVVEHEPMVNKPSSSRMVKQDFKFHKGNGFNFEIDADGNLVIKLEAAVAHEFEEPMFNESYFQYLSDIGVRDIDAVLDAAREAADKAINREVFLNILLDNEVK